MRQAALAPLALVLLSTLTGASTLERAERLARVGLTEAGQAVVDSLLAQEGYLDPEVRAQAEWLRARLEIDGESYVGYLQRMLDAEDSAVRSRARVALGHVAFARGNLDEALILFRQARDEGRHEEGNLWIGLTAMALGDGAEAREALGEASSSGNSVIRQRAWVALGDVHRATFDYSRAARAYAKVREDTRPGAGWLPVALLREAECRRELGDEEASRELLLNLLAEYPGSYEAPMARRSLDRLEAEAPKEPRPEDAEDPASPDAGGGFALQMGAFGVRANADRLLGTLRSAGASSPRLEQGGDALFRVLVGTFGNRTAAESYGDSLGAALGLGFSVVPTGEP